METTIDTPRAKSPWIYGPALDLMVGCGAWSAPLLLLGALQSSSHAQGWAAAFYLLAVVFNYPHFMATIYRAYHTRSDFSKYRLFTIHLTVLLVLTAVLAHASFRFLPWVFTLYICWSPWHYSGQNFGLLMMFARRSGVRISAGERRMLYWAFVASYLMLLVSFHTGPSNDPLILSLGLSARWSVAGRLMAGAVFLILGAAAFFRLAARSGSRALAAPLTLYFTQALWFVLPTLLVLGYHLSIPQTRYSSGLLAVLHSTQYLWITSYYARREARAAGNPAWRMWSYFVTLLAGGIALFIPGPWLVSLLLHYDFSASFLIFTALVNIHHFILDGAIWKLRDTRVAALLIDGGVKTAATAPETLPQAHSSANSSAHPSAGAWEWLTGSAPLARGIRVALVAIFLLWCGVDQIRYFLSADESNLGHLRRAAILDPYDTTLQLRLAGAEATAGETSRSLQALDRAVAANPGNPGPQHARARALLENKRYPEAEAHYRQMLARFPRDPDALVSFGLLASQRGHVDEAIDNWQKALAVDPQQASAHLYLAQAFEQRGQPAVAARHYQEYLKLSSVHGPAATANARPIISVSIALADALARAGQTSQALQAYQSAIVLAERDNDPHLSSLALAHIADLLERNGDVTAAAISYQRGLALDARAGDPATEAADWFNYGQFLRQERQPARLIYACFVHAEDLLASSPGKELETVKELRRQAESQLGPQAAAIRKNLSAILTEATALKVNPPKP